MMASEEFGKTLASVTDPLAHDVRTLRFLLVAMGGWTKH